MCVLAPSFFLQFRERVEQNYAGLFETTGDTTTSAVGNFATKWGWYQSIFALAKGDVRHFEDITKLNFHQCLTALEFMKEKTEIEQKQIKKSFK